LNLEFLALEQDESARELFHDLAPALVKFALLAAEILQLALLPLDLLLLPLEVEELFLDVLDLEVDLVRARGAVGRRRAGEEILLAGIRLGNQFGDDLGLRAIVREREEIIAG